MWSKATNAPNAGTTILSCSLTGVKSWSTRRVNADRGIGDEGSESDCREEPAAGVLWRCSKPLGVHCLGARRVDPCSYEEGSPRPWQPGRMDRCDVCDHPGWRGDGQRHGSVPYLHGWIT